MIFIPLTCLKTDFFCQNIFNRKFCRRKQERNLLLIHISIFVRTFYALHPDIKEEYLVESSHLLLLGARIRFSLRLGETFKIPLTQCSRRFFGILLIGYLSFGTNIKKKHLTRCFYEAVIHKEILIIPCLDLFLFFKAILVNIYSDDFYCIVSNWEPLCNSGFEKCSIQKVLIIKTKPQNWSKNGPKLAKR